MIFQEPMTSLNPYMPIGKQVAETVQTHNPQISNAEAEKMVLETLQK